MPVSIVNNTIPAGSGIVDAAEMGSLASAVLPEALYAYLAEALGLGADAGWKAVSAGDYHSLGIKPDGTLWGWGRNNFGQLGDTTGADRSVPTQVGDDTDWEAVSAGADHSLAVKSDGTLWAWGSNQNGQLGDATTAAKNAPVQVGTDDGWSAVAAGYRYSLALKSDGTVWGWGTNSAGQVGDGTVVQKNVPVQIGTGMDWETIAVGDSHSLAIKSDGSLWAWGSNASGQLGDGTSGSGTNKNAPVRIGTGDDWATVAAGGTHSLAIKDDGTLYAWGANAQGQLGDSTNANKNAPVQVGTDDDWSAVAAGYQHSLGVKSDGTLYAWGANGSGRLGDNTTVNKNAPVKIGDGTDWVTVAAGNSHSLGLKSDGTLWAWGSNQYGQLGDGTAGTANNRGVPTLAIDPATPDTTAPVSSSDAVAFYPCAPATVTVTAVDGIDGALPSGVAAIHYRLNGDATQTVAASGPLSVGTFSTPVAISTDGTHTLEFWATDNAGNIEAPAKTATFFVDIDTTPPTVLSDAAAGYLGEAVITITGTDAESGMASVTYIVDSGTPVETLGSMAVATVSTLGTHTIEYFATDVAGNDSVTVSKTFEITALPTGFVKWASVSAGDNHSLGLKSDGTLWAWGQNSAGQLGDGTTVAKNAPVRIGNHTDWQAVATGGSYSLALKADGSLYAWGSNQYGQLGDGTVGAAMGKNAPVRVGTDNDWTAVAAGNEHSLGLKGDGTLWSWGRNSQGQLGDGTTGNKAVPTQVGADDDWMAVAGGNTHSLALKSDGSLWAWGQNGSGQLGDGTTAGKSVPTRVGTGMGWETASGYNHTLALKDGGTLWAWGNNGSGQLGDGTTGTANNKNAPVLVGTGFSAISAGRSTHSLAIKADGTLYAWGSNGSGQLGDGTNAAKSTPTQVGTGTGWTAVSGGASHSLAIKSDGSLWAWGANTQGQLGDGTNAAKNVPTLVDGPPLTPDVTPPVSSSDATSSYTESATIIITATDDGPAGEESSGVAHITYILNGSAPVTVTGDVAAVAVPTPGSYILEFWATDVEGNEELPHNTVTFVVDLAPDVTPPVSSVAGAVSDPMPGAVAQIVITATDTAGSAYEESSGVKEITYSVNGGGPTVTASDTVAFTVSGTGIYTLEFFATDNAGNQEATKTANFYLGPVMDTTAPVSSSDVKASYTTSATVTITATDEAGGSGVDFITYSLDGSAPVTVTGATAAVTVSIPDSLAHTYTLEFFAIDIAGNAEATQSVTFTVEPAPDVTPPVSDSDAAGSYDTSATITITAVDAVVVGESSSGVKEITYILNGGTPTTVAGGTAVVTAEEFGSYTLEFFATDVAGNAEATNTVSFTVRDVTAPVSSSDAKASYDTSAIIAITATDEVGGSGVGFITYILNGLEPTTAAGDTAAVTVEECGDYTLEFFATDIAGNVEATQSVTFTIRDVTAPVSSSDAKASYTTSATVTITATDEVGGSGVDFITYSVNGSMPTTVAGGTAAVSVSIPDSHAHTYTLEFFATDIAGNAEATQSVTFTVVPAPDVTSPVSDSDAAGSYDTSATITITAVDAIVVGESSSGVGFITYSVNGSEPTTVAGDTAAVTVEECGDYTLEFFATDIAGNAEATNTATFTVRDVTAPVSDTDVKPSYTTSATVTITATDEAGGSGVDFITYSVNGSMPATVVGDTADVTVSVPDSLAHTYTLEFFATDIAGNAEATQSVTFTVNPAPDVTAPMSSSDAKTGYTDSATITITATDMVVIGEASSGIDFITYRVNGGPQIEVTGDTAEVIITEAGSYILEFWATDVAGNKEFPYNMATFTVAPSGTGSITRVFGADRFATAIEVSKANFESADSVILATGMNYADALSASALAGSLSAPLLLTRTDALSAGVLAEIERLGAKKVYIMGSSAAVSNAVEASLAGAGLQVERVQGADRYATSAAVAQKVAGLEGTSFAKKAFLARGDNFADGLAASPLAYRNKIPVVLTRPAELSAPAANVIGTLDINDITILGSSAAVSEGVEGAVNALGTVTATRRLQGADRYATAQEIAKYAFANSLATMDFIGVATGLNFPDALAGGVAAGERGGIIILTAPDALSANWVNYLSGAYGDTKPDIQLYGGDNVLSDNVMGTLKSMLID
ncbi:MAG: cell wall-binding repeat-containing protein [Coriobacteriia bacterium]|nr:cell wall-binding repeat-containing protein [Coriobacteriia bacterium]